MWKPGQQNKALKLLKEYRPALWRKAALEAAPGTHSKSLSVCLEQIRLTKELAETLKSDNRIGEKMYWVLHATFMTSKQPGGIEEILAYIADEYEHVPRRTYFRLKKQAIERLNGRLDEMEAQLFREKTAT